MSSFGTKPRTLSEVALRSNRGEQAFDAALREFLDAFYSKPASREETIVDRPPPIDALHDAYIAAVAEHLSRSHGLPIPKWTEVHGNDLHEPFFAGGLESLKSILIAESPAAFRRRLLFVSKDALSRARLQE